MNEVILKIGTVQEVDEEGYIINNLSSVNIQKEYNPILEDTLQFYKTHFQEDLHSIYVRGSVAKGLAIPYISDVDTIAILNRTVQEQELINSICFEDKMKQKYEYLNGAELDLRSIDEVMSSKKIQFVLQTQSKCIYGEDLRSNLSMFKIDKWAYKNSNSYKSSIEKTEDWLNEERPDEELKQICSWIMKRTVRVGFELIMEKEQCYTRDLYPCYELFSKYYPEKSTYMRQALKKAVYPTSNVSEIRNVLDKLSGFLIKSIKAKYQQKKSYA